MIRNKQRITIEDIYDNKNNRRIIIEDKNFTLITIICTFIPL